VCQRILIISIAGADLILSAIRQSINSTGSIEQRFPTAEEIACRAGCAFSDCGRGIWQWEVSIDFLG
jgi:hypothetical protein